ncbi:MAG: PhzF family phenazine biosynthesis protein [Bacteroidetes bacterium]|nr:PhzF family phenazine biosynthesis protein [Bacteroidota bacterium]
MKQLRFKHVDAFTTTPFCGNYAGVILNADELSEKEMQFLAREMNLPETAFVLRPTLPHADFRIRWFTPTTEVPLCGHATVAAFHALAEDGEAGMHTNGQHYFQLQTKSGILPVKVEKNFCRISIELDLPHPKFSVVKNIPSGFMKALDLSVRDREIALPIVKANYLYFPVARLQVLQKLHPKFDELAKLLRRIKVSGLCIFSLETVEKTSSVHSRFFAPHIGIPEDPVTGSANGPLGAYLFKYGILRDNSIVYRTLPDGRLEFIGEQGDELGRPGRVRVRVAAKGHTLQRLSIVGEAITVVSGTLSI